MRTVALTLVPPVRRPQSVSSSESRASARVLSLRGRTALAPAGRFSCCCTAGRQGRITCRAVAKLTAEEPPAAPSLPALLNAPARLALTLALGSLGAAGALAVHSPLPFMLGSLFATGVSALSGAPLALPKRVRLLWQTVIGTALGSTFTTALLERVSSLGVSVCGLMLLSAASTASVAFIFRRFGRYDAATAFFAAVPGGLNDMTQIGADSGGDERTIALSHTVRLVLVVCVLPLTLRYFAPATSAPAAAAAGAACSAFTAGWSLAPPDAAILLGCALLGPALGRLLRIPAPFLVGPMIASAAVHLAGWTAARPPPGLLSAAQVVVGAAVGVRFLGVRLASLRRIAALAVATTGLQLALVAAAAEALRRLTGAGFPLLLLAMAPGGITEMTLTALALGLDPSFVATHHTMRIAAVVSLTPLAFALHARLRPDKEA